jgi:hypothetical protein
MTTVATSGVATIAATHAPIEMPSSPSEGIETGTNERSDLLLYLIQDGDEGKPEPLDSEQTQR